MDFKIAMPIRTSDGISKIINIRENVGNSSLVVDCENEVTIYNFFEEIKASFNITDLLEVGDYVNGEKITYIDYGDTEKIQGLAFGKDWISIDNIIIESIVTHEQFESMQYKIEIQQD